MDNISIFGVKYAAIGKAAVALLWLRPVRVALTGCTRCQMQCVGADALDTMTAGLFASSFIFVDRCPWRKASR